MAWDFGAGTSADSDDHIYGLVQDCSNSSALAMELMQSCAKPSICTSISS